VMGAASGFGEYEEYFVLCRGCKESEQCTRTTRIQ
jgi:hypothetical protein